MSVLHAFAGRQDPNEHFMLFRSHLLRKLAGISVFCPGLCMDWALSWTSALAVHTLSSWWAGRECICHCECAGSPDAAVLSLLDKQLQRCGPANLTVAPAPGLGFGFLACVVLVSAALGAGGLAAAQVAWQRRGGDEPRGDTAGAALAEGPEDREQGLQAVRCGGRPVARKIAPRAPARISVGSGDSDW